MLEILGWSNRLEREVTVIIPLEFLSLSEVALVKHSLRAAVEGKFFPEWEFETLFGVDRETVRKVYLSWPRQTIEDEVFWSAVIGSMNNLLGYPHGREEELTLYVPEGRTAILETLHRFTKQGR